MAAITSAVAAGVSALAAVGSLANSVEQGNNQRRAANQAVNGAREDAASAAKQQAIDDANTQAQRAANQSRMLQRNRIAGVGAGVAAPQNLMAQTPAINPQPAQTPGSTTLLGQ